MFGTIQTNPENDEFLPTNIKAEQSLLGSVFLNNGCLDSVNNYLDHTHLFHFIRDINIYI